MWKKLKSYLFFLLAIAAPGVDDPFDDPDPNDPEPNDPDPNDPDPNDPDPNDPEPNDPDPNDPDPNDPDPEPQPRISRAQKAIIETRERAQRAEEQLRDAQRQLEEARRQAANPQPVRQTEEQRLWEEEEAVLRNPEADQWQRYAVMANREARAAKQESRNVARQAADLNDKATFAQLAATKPKLYDAYKDRVEAELQRIRANGNDAPREGILQVLIGRDMLDGKLKTGSTTATSKKAGAGRTTPPSGRSDVNATSGRLTDAEKRAKRLENIRI